MCGTTYDPDKIWNLCPDCHKPLLARYDLEEVKKSLQKDTLTDRGPRIWRYHELLPVRDKKYQLSLYEGSTPLFLARNLGQHLNFEKLYIKDEGLNPTTSFKARGLCVAVSRVYELGVKEISIPSAGNAAGAMSAYAALAGIKAVENIAARNPMQKRKENTPALILMVLPPKREQSSKILQLQLILTLKYHESITSEAQFSPAHPGVR